VIQVVVLVNLECDQAIACNPGERFPFAGETLAAALAVARASGWRVRRRVVACPACRGAK
jgi:hypothetical protein